MGSKSSFTVVTDSTADIPAQRAADDGIVVVPLTVAFGEDTMLDGELTQEEFFARMGSEPRLPTTAQPPVGLFVEAYERALETAENVISVHISNRLSGTIESARQAASRFAGRVHVFDSLSLSWGLGWQVVEAAAAAAEGLSPASAIERLERARARARIIVGLDSLENLARGGRIGKVSAFLGGLLSVKVTLSVDENGEFFPVARTRGEKAALEHTLDWVSEQMAGVRRGKFAVGYALSAGRAERLAQEIRARFDVDDLLVYEAGSVICAHTGTGWGVCFLPAE